MESLSYMELLALLRHHVEPGATIDVDRIIEIVDALKYAAVMQDKAQSDAG